MLEIAKLIHEAIGIESPRKFVLVCALVGAILFYSLGWLIDKGYRAKLKEEAKSAVPQLNEPANASGSCNGVNSGNGGKVDVNCGSAPQDKKQ